MELSIIVSVYNMAGDMRLENCLSSLLEQTIFDYEIIVVDNASTDGTSQILLDFAALYPDVFKVIQSGTYVGKGGAYNLGIKYAKGKWFAFVDSIDQVEPTIYERLLSEARNTGADLVGCNGTYDVSQTGILDLEKREWLLMNFGELCTKIYKRKIVLDCGMSFPEMISGAEKVMECAIVLRAKHYEHVPELLYISSAHDNIVEDSLNKTEQVLNKCKDYMEAARLLLQFAQDFGYCEEYYKEIEYRYAELAYITPLSLYLSEIEDKKPTFLKMLKKEIKAEFPQFERNSYYRARISEEERREIRIHQCSNRMLILWCRYKNLFRKWKKGGWKRLGMEATGSVLGMILCFVLVWMVIQDRKTEQYDVVILGDSVVANDYLGDDLDEIISDACNAKVFNGGFGGSNLSNPNIEGYESYGEETLSLEELANSIVTGDFLVQKSVIKKVSKLDYFESRLNTLSKIDFDKVSVLIVEHCVNDYVQQIPPEQMGNALKEVIIKIQTRYPELQIIVCSPTFCYIQKNGENLYCDTTELGEFVLEEYIVAEEQVCKNLGIAFVNNYHQDVITKETLENYSFDGLHLNEDGRRVMAENILAVMNKDAEKK